VLTANTVACGSGSLPGVNGVRVRATAWTSGTANVILVARALPIEPVVSAVQMPVRGDPDPHERGRERRA
jgi:hypothetical protein